MTFVFSCEWTADVFYFAEFKPYLGRSPRKSDHILQYDTARSTRSEPKDFTMPEKQGEIVHLTHVDDLKVTNSSIEDPNTSSEPVVDSRF